MDLEAYTRVVMDMRHWVVNTQFSHPPSSYLINWKMGTHSWWLALQLINPDVEITMVENTPDDPRQRKPDITKAKELLGWEPKIKLRDGLPLMEEDFRLRLGVPGKKWSVYTIINFSHQYYNILLHCPSYCLNLIIFRINGEGYMGRSWKNLFQ